MSVSTARTRQVQNTVMYAVYITKRTDMGIADLSRNVLVQALLVLEGISGLNADVALLVLVQRLHLTAAGPNHRLGFIHAARVEI